MSILSVDEVMLREPRLLIPRQMPVGPVVGNRDNPLVAKAAWAYLLNPGRQWNRPIFGKRQWTLTPVTAAAKADSDGIGLVATTRLTLDSWTGLVGSGAGDGTGDMAVLIHASPISRATQQVLYHQRYAVTDPYNAVFFRVNGYVTDGGTSSTINAGSVYFGTLNAPTPNSRGVRVDGRVNGMPHCWLGVRRSHVYELWEDGRLIGSADQTAYQVDFVYDAVTPTALGGFTSVDTVSATEPIHLVVGWDLAPTAIECAEVTRDPYSLFVPA